MANPTINGVAPTTEQLAALHTAASMQAGFDASPPQDKAAFQAAVSGGVSSSLSRWRTKLAVSPSTAVLAINGDSTSDESTSAVAIRDYLRNMSTQPGEPLAGVSPSNVVVFGYSGMSLEVWLSDPTKLAALVSAAPDLVVASWLINDVRLGHTTWTQARARMVQYIDTVHAALPNAEICLRIPNPLLTTNVGGLNYVKDALGNINPAGLAQAYSDLIRTVYLSLAGVYPYVEVWDVPAEIFGTVCRASHPLIADQLHPSPRSTVIGNVPANGGYVEIAKALARKIGRGDVGFVLTTNQYKSFVGGFVCSSAGSGYFDITMSDANTQPAAQFPLSNSDVAFIQGFDTPISLSGATIFRPFGGDGIRVSKSGDWSAMVGRKITIAGSHPDATTGDRQVVSVDLPAVAAGAYASIAVAVTGVHVGSASVSAAVSCAPGGGFVASGLILVSTVPSGADTVRVTVLNPTGAIVDVAAENWAFWVIR